MRAAAVGGMGKSPAHAIEKLLGQLLVDATQRSLGWPSTQGQQLLLEGVLEKCWSGDEKEELMVCYKKAAAFLPCFYGAGMSKASVCKTRRSFQANCVYTEHLLSRFLKVSLVLAALPRLILHRWTVSLNSSSGKQKACSPWSAHTRRTTSLERHWKSKLITARTFSSAWDPSSLLPLLWFRFSTLKRFRILPVKAVLGAEGYGKMNSIKST